MQFGKLKSYLQKKSKVPESEYDIIREFSPRNCHDVIIYFPEKEEYLLAIRGQEPMKGVIWPFGGGQKLGFSLDESIGKIVCGPFGESGLNNLKDLEYFGRPIDHLWSAGPKNLPVHDVVNYFTAVGEGVINPDKLHKAYLINSKDYFDKRNSMKHWVRMGMDQAIRRFENIYFEDNEKFLPKYYLDGEPFFD